MTESQRSDAPRLDTLAVHAGRADLDSLGVHALPLDLSTTNPVPSIEAGGASYEHLATGKAFDDTTQSAVYQRLHNPTTARYEQALAALEGAEAAIAFSSGMAAVTAAILAAAVGDTRHIVALRPLYGGTDHILKTGLLGTTTTFVASVDEVAGAITDETCLVIAETPANPTVELVDLRALVDAAGAVPVMVDNTFATPILQQPLRFGVQIVMHSATKYIGGHGDVLGGIIACGEDWAQRIRSVRAITGAISHPLSSYLAHRGIATLPLRIRQQQSNAQEVAAALQATDGVERVLYPGLPECDPQGLVGSQMSGPGAMLAVDAGSFERAAHVAENVQLFTHAVSLGGVDSLIQHPASLTHRPVESSAKPGDGILRLSIGLEDPADLIADLRQALASAPA